MTFAAGAGYVQGMHGWEEIGGEKNVMGSMTIGTGGNVLIISDIKDAMFYLQASDIKVIAATEKTENTIFDIDFKHGCAIIMGSEDRGINPSILKLVDDKAKLPMYGSIASLNVSVACGAFLYEVVRQRL